MMCIITMHLRVSFTQQTIWYYCTLFYHGGRNLKSLNSRKLKMGSCVESCRKADPYDEHIARKECERAGARMKSDP